VLDSCECDSVGDMSPRAVRAEACELAEGFCVDQAAPLDGLAEPHGGGPGCGTEDGDGVVGAD
jgi:hypothetical protein